LREAKNIEHEFVPTDVEIEKEVNEDSLPGDCVNLFDKAQTAFYSNNKKVLNAYNYIRERRLDTAINRPRSLWYCMDDRIHKERIIIPFYDQNNMLLGFQGRAINPSKIKYITIKLHESNKKIFGLNNVNFKQRIYVLEGPIDSMFLPNSIATMDASLDRVIDDLGCHDFVFIFDNEPRNKEIISHMKKIINLNKNICIWPNNIEEKDINDMILSGKSKSQILGIIDTHTFSNLRANLEFERWKKL